MYLGSVSIYFHCNIFLHVYITTYFVCLDCEERFRLEFAPDGTGEWAFKSDAYGFYLTGTDTQVSCFSKSPVWWSFRLATHPQVRLCIAF